MKASGLNRYALSFSIAAALLAGCGGSQPPIGAPGAVSQSPAIAMHVAHGTSWMLPPAKVTLIYAAGDGYSYVLSARTGKLMGTIDTGAQSVCSDSQGNVWLTGQYLMLEFAHGGTTPIATLNLPGSYSEPIDCSVDRTTGNLAVTFRPESGQGQLAVFADAQGTPQVYAGDFDLQFCGYDNQGNLFMDGFGASGTELAELPKGGSTITDISLGNQNIGGNPWSVQWDGTYITIEGVLNTNATINRLQISASTATIVGQTTFNEVTHGVRGSWIQGNKVLLPWGPMRSGHAKIGIWPYPAGGKVSRIFNNKDFGTGLTHLNDLTISSAK